MPMANENSRTDGHAVAFASSWEHLADELRCLDLRLHRRVLQQPREHSGDPLSPFKGLVITDAEVGELLTRPIDPDSGGGQDGKYISEDQRLSQSLADLQSEIQYRRSVTRQTKIYLTLERLANLFGLTRFEELCVIAYLAAELDRKYEKLYGYLQDDATCKAPSLDLILNLFCDTMPEKLEAREAFHPHKPLLRFNLLQVSDFGSEGQKPQLARGFRLDDRIVDFLLGSAHIDARLDRFASIALPVADETPAVQEVCHRANNFVQAYCQDLHSADRNLLLYLHGPASADKRLVVETVCRSHSLPLLKADLDTMKAGPLPFHQAAWLLAREAALQSAALCLERTDWLISEREQHWTELKSLLDAARTYSRFTFILGSSPWQSQEIGRAHV
jgi:hypothetical protein